MRFFLSIATIACLALTGVSLVACSSDGSPSGSNGNTAGIEIGNPTLALTADFTVDYSDVETVVLKKSAPEEGPVVLDSFALDLTEVRTYASYYIYMPFYNALEGMMVWPTYGDFEAASDSAALTVSFTDETVVDKAFNNIELLDGGFLKEIGVTFRPYVADDIYGRVKIDGEYVPFVYDLADFQHLQLRYHYSQIAIDTVNKIANLSVVFRAKLFTEGVDFSKANVSEDGVIYIDQKNNTDLWDELNERFVPSFQPLRYSYTNAAGEDSTNYVDDVWNGLAADVGENTLINGNFQSPFTTDWILVTQLGGKADTTVIVENEKERIMKVDVTEGGNNSYSVQLLQENVALIEGVKYKCVFTIWSDVADSITARIGSYDTYETVGFSKHVFVNTSGASIQEEFVAKKSDPFARFELNLGKQKRKFWIKEVQVQRLSK
ncbi:MAG: carbohydrate binding domain-containing protein [Fibrobacter sp.]|nr:carbohydrate binding domain-containing protein [Fibrobacter sp.]